MNSNFASRLKQARLLAKFSLRELSDQLNNLVSYNAIKKYEDGKMMPDESVIQALAVALGVQTDYFFKTSKVELTNVEFRKRAKLTVKEVISIKEIVRDQIERYLEVESILRIEQKFDNPLKGHILANIDDLEEYVLMLLKIWNLGYNQIPNVIEMLEERGVKVVEISAPDAFDGMAALVNDIPVVVLNKDYTAERKRFTALHELGHILLTFPEDWDNREVERCCHRFASAMLIPKPVMLTLLGKQRNGITLAELIAIKEQYGISLQAIVRRAKDLGIINEYSYKNFFIWISKNRREEGLGNFKGVEKSYRVNQLLYRLIAENLITFNKAASLSNMSTEELKRMTDRIL